MAYVNSSWSNRKNQSPIDSSKAALIADLKQKISSISKTLVDVFDRIDGIDQPLNTTPAEQTALAVARLRKIVATRKRRNHAFPEHHFADPAWDMILDLTIAMAENRLISVSSLSLAANVPTTTALRCINQLKDEGIIVVIADPKDGRRRYTQLSQNIYERMINFWTISSEK